MYLHACQRSPLWENVPVFNKIMEYVGLSEGNFYWSRQLEIYEIPFPTPSGPRVLRNTQCIKLSQGFFRLKKYISFNI